MCPRQSSLWLLKVLQLQLMQHVKPAELVINNSPAVLFGFILEEDIPSSDGTAAKVNASRSEPDSAVLRVRYFFTSKATYVRRTRRKSASNAPDLDFLAQMQGALPQKESAVWSVVPRCSAW